MNPQMLSILSAIAAAVWSVWSWKDQKNQERHDKLEKEAALFVNSLVLSTEVLQSRIYELLEEDELAISQEEGAHTAVEVLYLFSLHFGWGLLTYRYGPFTKDQAALEPVHKISHSFQSRDYPEQAFRVSMADRIALGRAAVRPIGEYNALCPAFEAVTLYEFEKELSESGQLGRCRAAQRILEALQRPGDLEGRERLAALQNWMVDLLEVVEEKRGFGVAGQQRPRAKLPTVEAPPPSKAFQILHQTPGRLRLGFPILESDPGYAERLQSLLTSLPDVEKVRVNPYTASAIVNYASRTPLTEMTRRVAAAVEGPG